VGKPPDLSSFIATNAPHFARTAYLLTGDADQARELTTRALIQTCSRRPGTGSRSLVDSVLRQLYRSCMESATPPRSFFPLTGLPVRAPV
jgi:hypothetical protein